MSKRDLKLLLEDMLESAQKINRYTSNLNVDSFQKDDKTIDAVVRNFEIIGEAANRIDPDFKPALCNRASITNTNYCKSVVSLSLSS